MAKERLSKLQKYILNNCGNKSITWNDALSGFYNIEGIKLKIYEFREGTLTRKRKEKNYAN